jgi:hypothetical protein
MFSCSVNRKVGLYLHIFIGKVFQTGIGRGVGAGKRLQTTTQHETTADNKNNIRQTQITTKRIQT